jgi:hypothetical protein
LPRASPCRRERCVSPTSATDCDTSTLCAARVPTALAFPLRDLAIPPRSGSRHQVELRLTAKLQLRLCHNPPGHPGGALRGPGRASIESPSTRCLPTAAFSTAGRACRLASDALCRDRPVRARPLGPARVDRRQDPPGPLPRQRQPLRRNQDAFRRRVASPTSAISTAHEHNHEPSDPRGRSCRRGLPSLRWTDRVGAPSASSTAGPR